MTQHPVLSRLHALVGEWELQASVGGQVVGVGRTSFQWQECPDEFCRRRMEDLAVGAGLLPAVHGQSEHGRQHHHRPVGSST